MSQSAHKKLPVAPGPTSAGSKTAASAPPPPSAAPSPAVKKAPPTQQPVPAPALQTEETTRALFSSLAAPAAAPVVAVSSDALKVRNYPGAEQERLKQRLALFYSQFAPDGLARLDASFLEILKTDATEDGLILKVCTKYKVPEYTERLAATAKMLLPKKVSAVAAPTSSSNASRRPSSVTVHPPADALPQRCKTADPPSDAKATTPNPAALAVSASAAAAAGVVTPAAPVLLRSYHPSDMQRVRRRLEQFYKARNVPHQIAKLDELMMSVAKFAKTEEQLFLDLANKYSSSPEEEVAAAKMSCLFPHKIVAASVPSNVAASHQNTPKQPPLAAPTPPLAQQQQQQQPPKPTPKRTPKQSALTVPAASTAAHNIAVPSSSAGGDAASSLSSPASQVTAVFVKSYSAAEQQRFRQRLRLFYEKHAAVGLAKLDNNLRLIIAGEFVEAKVMENACTKNNVDPAVELAEARSSNLLPPPHVMEPMQEEPEQGQRQRQATAADAAKPPSAVPVSSFSDIEKARLRRRALLFYETHARTELSIAEEKIANVLAKSAKSESELFEHLCAKNSVAAELERREMSERHLQPGQGEADLLHRLPVRDLPVAEKERLRSRLTLFYTNHAADTLSAADRGTKVEMALAFPVPLEELMERCCSKYNVATSVEIHEARGAGLLPACMLRRSSVVVSAAGSTPLQTPAISALRFPAGATTTTSAAAATAEGTTPWKERLVDERSAAEHFKNAHTSIAREEVDPTASIDGIVFTSPINAASTGSAYYDMSPSPLPADSSSPANGARRKVHTPVLVSDMIHSSAVLTTTTTSPSSNNALDRLTALALNKQQQQQQQQQQSSVNPRASDALPGQPQQGDASSQTSSVLLFGRDGLSLLQLRSPPKQQGPTTIGVVQTVRGGSGGDSGSDSLVSAVHGASANTTRKASIVATTAQQSSASAAAQPAAAVAATPKDTALSPLALARHRGSSTATSSTIATADEAAAAAATSPPKPGIAAGAPGEVALRDLSESEKKRFAARLHLFYSNHAKDGLARLKDNLKKLIMPKALDHWESAVFALVCERYAVAPEAEKTEAAAAGLLPPPITTSSSSSSIGNAHSVSEKDNTNNSNINVTVAKSSSTPAVTPPPLLFIQHYSAPEKVRLQRRVIHFYRNHDEQALLDLDNKMSKLMQARDVTEDAVIQRLCETRGVDRATEAAEARAAGCFECVVEHRQSIRKMPPAQQSRFRARLTLFYRKFSPHDVSMVDQVMGFSLTEQQVMKRVCDKYGVDPLSEEVGAKAHGVWTPPPPPPLLPQATLSASPVSLRSPSSSLVVGSSGLPEDEESLFMVPSSEELFSRFLRLSDGRKRQQQQQHVGQFKAERAFQSPGLTPALPAAEAVFSPETHRFQAALSEMERSQLRLAARPTAAQPSGYFISSRPIVATSGDGGTVGGDHLSPRAARAQRLLSALVDEYQLARDETQTMVQVAWGAPMSPDSHRSQRERMARNTVPWNCWPITTPSANNNSDDKSNNHGETGSRNDDVSDPYALPDYSPARQLEQQRQRQQKSGDPSTMTVAQHRQRFVFDAENILSPPPQSQKQQQHQQQLLAPPPHLRRDTQSRQLVNGRAIPTLASEGWGESELALPQGEHTQHARQPEAHHKDPSSIVIVAAGPLMCDEDEAIVEQRLASFLPSVSAASSHSSRSGSRGGGMPRNREQQSSQRQQHQPYPLSLTFHSVGSLPCPDNILMCPVCGEEIEHLVVETAEQIVMPLPEAAQRGARSRSSSSLDDSATQPGQHLLLRLSSVKSTDSLKSIASHLDRCIRRRRSFEEHVFSHSRRREMGGVGARPMAHLLLHALGSLTSFSQRAKKWSAEQQQHKINVNKFFKDVELLRMQHSANNSSDVTYSTTKRSSNTDDSVLISRDANLFDEFLGREVELFETGTRLNQELEALTKKSGEVLRSLQLPCPMGDKCIHCVAQARLTRTPATSREPSPHQVHRSKFDDDDDDAEDLSDSDVGLRSRHNNDTNNNHSRSGVSRGKNGGGGKQDVLDRGYITHSDVQDHAVACWEVTFAIEKAPGQFDALSSGGVVAASFGNEKTPRGATLKCPVTSGSQDTLWSLLSRVAPALVIRAANAPQQYIDSCAAVLADGEDELDVLFELSGLDFDAALPQKPTQQKLPQHRARQVHFLDDGSENTDAGDQQMIRIVFTRSFDNEVVDGSTPLWKCWWLEFQVFVL